MKVALHSDLHLEGNHRLPENFLEDKDFDVLVLAGDIVTTETPDKLRAIASCANKKPIIYIPGNHDRYWGSIESSHTILREVCESAGIIYADRQVVRIDGVNFVCCTGWSDLTSFDEYSHDEKTKDCRMISDFHAIENHTVFDMVKMAKADRKFIETSLEVLKNEHPNDKIVVVTHFAPTEAHNNPKFKTTPISSYFSNSWEEIMYEFEPDFWVFGHTHANIERDVYRTIVKTNQHGYGSECADTYDPNYIFTV